MLYQLSYFRMVCFSFAIAKVEQIFELPNFLFNFFPTFSVVDVNPGAHLLRLIALELETLLSSRAFHRIANAIE